MYKIFNISFFLKGFTIGLLAMAFTACTLAAKKNIKSHEKFEQRVDSQIVEQLKHPNHVIVAKMVMEDDRTFVMSSEQRELPKEKIETLQSLLLNDSHYHFDRTKKCVFIPELAFQFEGTGTVLVLANLHCNQIKITSGESSYILDYDPNAEQFNAFFREILALHNHITSS